MQETREVRPACTGELLNVRDAAKLVRLSTRQIYKLVRAKRFPSPFKLGGATRWRASDVAEFVAGGCKLADDGQFESTGAQ